MTLIPYTKSLSGAKQCQGCPKVLLKMSGLSSPSGHRCQLCKASLWYFTLFMVFPVRSATVYRVIKKKIACPRKTTDPFYLCPRYFVAYSIFGIIIISIRQFGNIIMLLLSKQLPHAAAWDKMASTSHYNNTIQKSPFIRLKRCCPDLPHTVITKSYRHNALYQQGYLRHIVQTAGKALLQQCWSEKTPAEYNCPRL